METQQPEDVYSVWALPPPEVCDRIKPLMSALRSEFGGPEFDPHITLVGAIRLTRESATRRLRSASEALSPYTARVAAVARGGFFYQCVYLLIEPTTKGTCRKRRKRKAYFRSGTSKNNAVALLPTSR